jgi:hypothetical protein
VGRPGDRQRGGDGGVFDPGDEAEAFLDAAEELSALGLGGVFGAGFRNGQCRGDDAIGVPAGAAFEQAGETALEDGGAAQEDEGEGHFGDDEAVADELAAPAAAGAAGLLLQGGVDVGARGIPRGHQAKHHAGEEGDEEGQREDARIKSDIKAVAGTTDDEAAIDDAIEREGDQEAEGTARQAEQDGFEDLLADQLAA